MAPPAVHHYDDRDLRRRRSQAILRDGVILGVLIIVLSIWLGTSSGSTTATNGITALGVGNLSVGILVLVVLLVAAFSAFLAIRDRVMARVGLRNVSRAKGRTAILLFGLLIGSMIISSSLVIGDTVNTLSVHFTYIADGAVDEALTAPLPPALQATGATPFSYGLIPTPFFQVFNESASKVPDVAGVTPMIVGTAGVYDTTTNVAQPGLRLVGVDASAATVLGSFTTSGGASLAGPAPGEVLLNPTAAQELSASAGDAINLTAASGATLHLHVLAVVQADSRGGFKDDGQGDVFTTLGDAQNATGAIGFVNYVAVTNSGGLYGGVAHTDSVWNGLNSSLVAAKATLGDWPAGIGVEAVLSPDLAGAENSASSLTQLFLVLGLFSIGAGCVLIVGIFAMLAEERRGEMGVARAIGTRRGQLVRAYYFEGLAYSAGSALVGTLLGVVVGWGIIQGFAALFGASGGSTTTQAIVQSFTYTPQSMILAYAAGFLLTLATVTITSTYVSRMNIVRAMRGQPELIQPRQSRRFLAVLGLVCLLVGALLIVNGRQPGTDIDVGFFGVSLSLLAVGMLLAVVLPLRYAFSAAAVALLVFWGDLHLRDQLFPGYHVGGIFVFFQEGIFLILAAVILYVFNSDLIVRAFAAVSRKSARHLPVVRLAFSYPAHRRFRSAMTISIFAMVLFTITGIAVIGNGITSGVNSSVQAQTGGYTFFGDSLAPIPQVDATVNDTPLLHDDVSDFVSFYSGGGVFQTVGQGGFTYSLAAAPTGVPSWENFYQTNQFNFSSTLDGMSASQVWAHVEEPNSTYAVLDGSFVASAFGGFGGSVGHPSLDVGDTLNFSEGRGGPTTQFTVIGVMSEQTIPVILINPQLMVYGLGFNTSQFFLLSAASSVNPTQVLQNFQTHFFSEGMELFDFAQLLSSTLSFTDAFIDLLEVFVALGLIVGITALGILALRAVTERRTQVGVVRAIGFRKSQVLTSFLLEYSFLALTGIGIGAVMGFVLAYNLYEALGGLFAFSIPWANVAVVLITSYGLTLVAVGIPSLRASRIPPAEAIRYTE